MSRDQWPTKCVVCFQDVEICVFELQKILNRVVMKSRITISSFPFNQADLCPPCSMFTPLSSAFLGNDIKTDGFSLTTCRNMVNLLDVSFHVEQTKGRNWDIFKEGSSKPTGYDGSMSLCYWTDETTWLRQWWQEVMREHVWAVNGMTGWHENFRPKHANKSSWLNIRLRFISWLFL